MSDVAKMMNISVRTVFRCINLFYSTGDIILASRNHGPLPLLGDYEQIVLLQLILESPGLYLHEIQELLQEKLGVWVHVSMVCKTLHRMGCTRQRIQYIALQRSDECGGRTSWVRYLYMTPRCLCG